MISLTHLRRAVAIAVGSCALITVLSAFQRPFKEYPGLEYNNFPLPPDYQEKTEWAFARLMYPPVGRYYGGVEFNGSWKEGGSNWTMDYPRSDRHLSAAVRRLTRIHARSAEEPVDLDDNDVYDWPWLYGVEVGHWNLTDYQAQGAARVPAARRLLHVRRLPRRHRVGCVPDQHAQGVSRPADCGSPNDCPIFHTIYDLDDRYQVPGALFLETHLTYEKGETGKTPHWRGIYDDQGRVMVAMCHNMDLGDSWEHADNPRVSGALLGAGACGSG